MNITPTPPPFQVKPQMSLGTKIVLLGLQCAVLAIGSLTIWLLSYSRENSNLSVAKQISSQWGEDVRISGPYAVETPESSFSIQPEIFNCNVNIETQSLHRNIYETEVFNAHIDMTGTFCKNYPDSIGDTLCIMLKLPSAQLARLSPLEFGGKKISWHKTDKYLYANVDMGEAGASADYAISFDIHGSKEIEVIKIGKESNIQIEGEAPNPSFAGSYLPDRRLISGRRFSANWETNEAIVKDNTTFDYTKVRFLVGVDRYQKVQRSLKYAFLIIVLTYISVLFSEIVMKRNIPMLNYFLIGAALVIFYILLLSFSEHMSFAAAYIIASTMTVALITGYMWRMLGSRKVAFAIGTILIAMYVCCYILLTLTTYPLLLGSLVLYAALAAMMYGSLQIKRQ